MKTLQIPLRPELFPYPQKHLLFAGLRNRGKDQEKFKGKRMIAKMNMDVKKASEIHGEWGINQRFLDKTLPFRKNQDMLTPNSFDPDLYD